MQFKKKVKFILIYCLIFFINYYAFQIEPPQNDYPISTVPFTKVKLTDNFWKERVNTNREITIPFGFNKCEEEGRIRNFERAGGLLEGKYEGLMPFDDTDVYKIIEGASYSLQTNPDKILDKYIDDIIEKISAAQEDDGYLTTWKTIDSTTTPANWVKHGPRWFNLGASHELYNAGHLYEAAYAHYRATGKTNFLNIALKNADLIDNTFGNEKLLTPPGHQIIETGLIKLYKATNNIKYLNLAKFFLDIRGDSTGHKLYGSYNQDHLPVIMQNEAVGHAVRAVYMYAGMTDIAAMMNEKKYLSAINNIWENVVSKKIYITGGIGALHQGEAFGNDYELPNLTAYNETCAAIGNVYWNYRMFLLHGDSKYIDVLERTLYNGMIAGVSLNGDSFFYPNCLTSDGNYKFNQGALTRKEWFDCSCCPSNIIRFLPSVSDYIYAQNSDTVYVNLFIANETKIQVGENEFKIIQSNIYPWDGKINFKIETEQEINFTLKIRIPGWTKNFPIPSNLYSYIDKTENKYSIKLNNEIIDYNFQKGYLTLDRKWKSGDLVELNLPMEIKKVIANESVIDDKNMVAIERGPIVYCAEGIDNEGKIFDIVVPDEAKFSAEFNEANLNGIVEIKGNVERENGNQTELKLIPYYAWSHRGIGEMSVWLKRK